MKTDKGLSGITGNIQFPIPTPPERNIVLVPSAVADEARQLREAGKYEEALALLEKHTWARIR